ncbi:MAG: nucleotidyltransferase family protein [Gemmatimonadales bacterium]
MTATHAVVLAAGLGTRMRRAAAAPLTEAQAAVADAGIKAMIPVGRPFLDYCLSALADAGLTDVCLVIGPAHDVIRRRYTEELRPERLRISFAVQERPVGTANAVLAAEPVVGAVPFLVVNSDNLYPVAALRALARLPGAGVIGYSREALIAESNIDPERIARFALAWADDRGLLRALIEKPEPDQLDPAAFVSMNSWRFQPSIFDACREVRPSVRGELELQDAVRILIERGEPIAVVPFAGGVLDLSSRTDVESVAVAVRSIDVRV